MSEADPKTDAADVRLLPPLVLLVIILAALGLQALAPLTAPLPPRTAGVVGWIVAAAGFALAAPAVQLFLAQGEKLPPNTPTNAIVEAGPYRFTRNPMYLGMALLIAAVFFWTRTVWAAAGLIVFVWIIHSQVILKEEAYLKRKFGAPYEAYLARVRRWI